MEISSSERFDLFSEWLSTSSGAQLRQAECEVIERLIPRRYFPAAVLFGSFCHDLVDLPNCGVTAQIQHRAGTHTPGTVVSKAETLPFGHHTIDLAVLPHTLDFTSDPHALLRELTQSMAPDGTLLVTGFQPYSLWGLRKVFRLQRHKAPWLGNFISPGRMQDWLLLMGYRVAAGKMLMYRPPLNRERWFERLSFMEKAGDRWWPMLGAVYVLVARLETMRILPVGPALARRRLRPQLIPVSRRLGHRVSCQREQ